MTHTCHAINCAVYCSPLKLMCSAHWFMVPRDIQKAVIANYRHGQCDDKHPSREWFLAADLAITYVAYRENKVTLMQMLAKWDEVERANVIKKF